MTHTQTERGHLIGIIGTGPAGLYATKKLTEAGAHVVLLALVPFDVRHARTILLDDTAV